MTSVISFGLPLLRKCSPCPDSEANPDIECPRPPGTYGNFVNVRCPLKVSVFSYLNANLWSYTELTQFWLFFILIKISAICVLFLQFYCSNDKQYNDLATIFFNTQVSSYLIKLIYLLLCYSAPTPLITFFHVNLVLSLLQDDAIRNLFSAKTFHEYSAKSLITFLVIISPHSSVLCLCHISLCVWMYDWTVQCLFLNS